MLTEFAAQWLGSVEAVVSEIPSAPPAIDPFSSAMIIHAVLDPKVEAPALSGLDLFRHLAEVAPAGSFAAKFSAEIIARRRWCISPKQEQLAKKLLGEINERAERPAQAPRAPVAGSFVGDVGNRINFVLTVRKVLSFEGEYGTTRLHFLVDSEGNTFKWATSSRILEEGETYAIKGTIKAHAEYRGVKQTILSRCVAIRSK